MVVVAQLVERFSVEEEVTGAEPVYHPKWGLTELAKRCLK